MKMSEELSLGAKKQKKVIDELGRTPEYISDIEKLRLKHKIPPKGFQFNEDDELLLNIRNQLNVVEVDEEFQKDLMVLLNKYPKQGLNPTYRDTILRYILFNRYYVSKLNFGLKPNWLRIPAEYGSGEVLEGPHKELFIQIYGNTTLDDLKKGWSEIEKLKKELPDYNPKKFRPYKNNERDKRIIEMLEGGKDVNTIVTDINDEFPSEWDKQITYDYIYKIKQRYLKKT
jgi:hypothetical protein